MSLVFVGLYLLGASGAFWLGWLAHRRFGKPAPLHQSFVKYSRALSSEPTEHSYFWSERL